MFESEEDNECGLSRIPVDLYQLQDLTFLDLTGNRITDGNIDAAKLPSLN